MIYLTSLAVALSNIALCNNSVGFVTNLKTRKWTGRKEEEELEYRTDTWFGVGFFLHRSNGFVEHLSEVEFLLGGTFYQ